MRNKINKCKDSLLHNYYKPIFIQGMMGGGTGIIWNLIQSHPFCSGIPLETNEALSFRYRDLLKSVYRKKSIFLINFFKLIYFSRKYGFSPIRFRDFNKTEFEVADLNGIFDRRLILAIDEHLFHYKMEKIKDPVDRYKYPGKKYTFDELKKTRLVAKNNENLCYYASWFMAVYPSSKFVSIVRNPYAICESQLRNNRSPSIVEVARRWNQLIGTMTNQSVEQPDKFLIVKYEDLVANPIDVLKSTYKFLDLDFDQLRGISIHIRNFLGKERSFMKKKKVGHKYWITIEDLSDFFQPNINERSKSRLNEHDIMVVNEHCGAIMESLGYKSN